MTRSERVYRAMLLVYLAEYRSAYGDPMTQLFRDRLRRDGGGFGTVRVWTDVGFDLAGSAFIERLETAMNVQTWTSRWWEAAVLIYAITQTLFGISIANNVYLDYAIAAGYVPAALLLGGLMLRSRLRGLATAMIVVGSLLPAISYWILYLFVAAAVVIGGGLRSGKIGRSKAAVPTSG